MGQDCSVYSAWMGHCHWTEMLTGEVIVGLLTVIVAIVAVVVAVKQIKKQEELTREQIAATMEATQKQLEEMRKAQEPEVDIIISGNDEDSIYDKDSVFIEVFNAKNVPVYVRGYEMNIKWVFNDREYDQDDFYLGKQELEKHFSVIVPEKRKILSIGETYQLELKYDFFKLIVDADEIAKQHMANEGDEDTKYDDYADFIKGFHEKLKRIEIVIKFDIPDLETEARLELTHSRQRYAFGYGVSIKSLGRKSEHIAEFFVPRNKEILKAE